MGPSVTSSVNQVILGRLSVFQALTMLQCGEYGSKPPSKLLSDPAQYT